MIKTYLVVDAPIWEKEKDNARIGLFETEKYGFIHSSTLPGLQKILDRFIPNLDTNLVLCINAPENTISWEDKDTEHLYPHFYDLIDKNNITAVIPLKDFIERNF